MHTCPVNSIVKVLSRWVSYIVFGEALIPNFRNQSLGNDSAGLSNINQRVCLRGERKHFQKSTYTWT